MLHASKRYAREERGASLVELALSLVIMFAFLFGIMELSLALYSYHFVSDAARDGTRYAIVRGYDWKNSCDGSSGNAGSGYTTSGCTASAADIQNYVQNLGYPGINGGGMTVTTTCASVIGGTFSTYSPSSTCNAATDVVQVTVSYPFTFGIPGFPKYTYNLSSTSQMSVSY